MGFTTATVTHQFTNGDGSDASGSVEFSLSKRMSQPGVSIMPSSITTTLGPDGSLSQVLTANNDPGTTPEDAQWRVDIRVLGASEVTEWITVPTGGGTVDLATLLPDQPNGG